MSVDLGEDLTFLNAVEAQLQKTEDVEPGEAPRAFERLLELTELTAATRAAISDEELDRSRRRREAYREFAGPFVESLSVPTYGDGTVVRHRSITTAEFHDRLGTLLERLVARLQVLFHEFLASRHLHGQPRPQSGAFAGGTTTAPAPQRIDAEAFRTLDRLHSALASTLDARHNPNVVHELDQLSLIVTRSDFQRRIHEDYFDVPVPDRTLHFGYYSADVQGDPEERRLTLLTCLLVRRWQARLILDLYAAKFQDADRRRGLDLSSGRTSFPRFLYHDDDDLRSLLTTRFDRLGGDYRAFRETLGLLVDYLRSFTISTRYNALDPRSIDENYFTKAYPKALTGQLIHDCGVYAARNAYLLGGIARQRGWKRYLILTPFHVDVVFTRSAPDNLGVAELPVLFTYNASFFGDPRLFSDSGSGSGTRPRRWYRNWRGSCPDVYPTARRTPRTTAFVGDVVLAGHQKVPVLDTPFKLLAVPPAATPARDRQRLWSRLSKIDSDRFLFEPPDRGSGLNDLELRYLAFHGANAALYNDDIRHLWNVAEKRARSKLRPDPENAVDAFLSALLGYDVEVDVDAYLDALWPDPAAGRAADETGLDAYLDAFDAAIDAFRDAVDELDERFAETERRLRSDPDEWLVDDAKIAVADCSTPAFGFTRQLNDYRAHADDVRTPSELSPDDYIRPYLPRRR
jgi:hypothetical protein